MVVGEDVKVIGRLKRVQEREVTCLLKFNLDFLSNGWKARWTKSDQILGSRVCSGLKVMI
jgi:hypothetical protein